MAYKGKKNAKKKGASQNAVPQQAASQDANLQGNNSQASAASVPLDDGAAKGNEVPAPYATENIAAQEVESSTEQASPYTETPSSDEDVDATPRSGNAFSKVPAIVWGFFALALAVAALGGYVAGEKVATNQFIADNPDSNTAIQSKLAKVKPGANGTKGDGPVAKADGTYDAMIVGPGGKLESAADIQNVHRRNANDPFAIGAIDAPVVISEFSDFECPFCTKYTMETEPTLMQEYVEKGLVRIEWNDMPINGPDAVAGAKAGRAAAEQGKFMEFKKALYEAASSRQGHPGFKEQDFVEFAKKAGVPDIEKFKADATGSKFDSVVNEAQQYAGGIGINGTPGFIVGTKFVNGAQKTEYFKQAIEQELAKTAGE